MEQPTNKVEVKNDDSIKETWVDIVCGTLEGDRCRVGVGKGETTASALRAAVKKLQALAREAEQMLQEETNDSG